MSSQYPPDEFDRAGEDMPIGMHRAQPSKWRSVIPFLVILIVVPLLGWAASQYLTSRGTSSDDAESSPVVAASPQSGAASGGAPQLASDGDDSTGTQPQSSTAEQPSQPPAQPADTGEVDMNINVGVLNGTDRSGYAAEQAGVLTAAGFPGVSAANATGWATQQSTVYYGDPFLKASAEKVAELLGITNVVQDQDTLAPTNYDVVVVLK